MFFRTLLIFVIFLLLGSPPAHAQNKNVFETKRGPSVQRQKADEEARKTLREGLGREFSPTLQRSSQSLPYFIAFFIFLAIVIGSLIYFDFRRQRRKQPSEEPRQLFNALCSVHELTRAEKRFLRELALEMELEDPLPLFIEPQYFFQALDDEHFTEARRTLEYLLRKLFDITVERDGTRLHTHFRTEENAGRAMPSGATTILSRR